MKTSPFKYGITVNAESFTNRETESKKLFDNLTQGINTTIISPRRWGKSSLVEKVLININEKEKMIKTISIDLFSVANEEEFLELLARETIKAASTQWEDWINSTKDFFKKLIPKISLGIDPANDFSISFDWEELKKHQDEILNLPEIIASKKNIRFIIAIDEFQNLASFKKYELLEKKMRANWQRHKKVTYCLYGSKRHMMTDIFNNPSKPFYRFGDIILLQKISAENWTKFIVQSFKRSSKKIAKDDAALIPRLMKNHSWYVQQLSHYVWQKTETIAGNEEIKSALLELIYANTPLYQKEVETISLTQVNLLKAITNKETQFTSTTVMQKYKLGTPRNVSKNKTTLINNDMIHEIDGKYELLDPAFELWFLKHYFNKNYP